MILKARKKGFRKRISDSVMVSVRRRFKSLTETDRLKVTEHVSQEYPEDGIKVFGIEYVDIVMVPSSQEISVPPGPIE